MDLPIRAQRPQYSTFDQKFQFKKGSSKKKKNSCERRALWAGRQKEPILSFVTKYDEKERIRAQMG